MLNFLGIVFKRGTFMPHLPIGKLLNRNDKTLPEATSKSFWLHGSTWQFPKYGNVETFIDRLVLEELLVREPVVEAVLANWPLDLSLRTIQRRFLHATGLTRGTLEQIDALARQRSFWNKAFLSPMLSFRLGMPTSHTSPARSSNL